MAIGRDIQQQLQTEKANQEFDEYGLPVVGDRQSVANMLGLMGSIATETITADIKQMIEKNLRKELNGYIFALSRIMRHDLAWNCVLVSFSQKNEPVPSKYFQHFGKSREENKPPKTMQVE